MTFQELVRARHSVRDFASKPVEHEKLQRVIRAAQLAPSAQNEQPWRFFVAQGKARKKLGELISQTTIHLTEYMDFLGPEGYETAARWYSELGKAPVLVCIASPGVEDALLKLNRHLSVGAALENLLLAVVDEGLAACNITFSHWVEDEIADYLGLPDDWEVLTIVALGYPGEGEAAAHERRTDDAVWLD
jgi:nitroreductase